MNVLNVLAAMPSTNISPAFLLVISQLPLTHLQFESAVQELEVPNFWHVFQVEKTPVRVSTPTIDLTVASATSQREVPEFQEHPLTPAQSPDESLAAQVSACLPSATTGYNSFDAPDIKLTRRLRPSPAIPHSLLDHPQERPFALLQVDSVWNFMHATISRVIKLMIVSDTFSASVQELAGTGVVIRLLKSPSQKPPSSVYQVHDGFILHSSSSLMSKQVTMGLRTSNPVRPSGVAALKLFTTDGFRPHSSPCSQVQIFSMASERPRT